jgi:hypothetical protein
MAETMKPKLPKVTDFSLGYLAGHKKGYDEGFVRASILIVGASPKWKKQERSLFNKATRQMFGKKRRR